MRILVMGLPGSGKTTFSGRLVATMQDVEWINADKVRAEYNDWDFSDEGRMRQAFRMREIADRSSKKHVVCDFVAALQKQREIFDPHLLIWMDTIRRGRYEDTNAAFERPESWDIRFSSWKEIHV